MSASAPWRDSFKVPPPRSPDFRSRGWSPSRGATTDTTTSPGTAVTRTSSAPRSSGQDDDSALLKLERAAGGRDAPNMPSAGHSSVAKVPANANPAPPMNVDLLALDPADPALPSVEGTYGRSAARASTTAAFQSNPLYDGPASPHVHSATKLEDENGGAPSRAQRRRNSFVSGCLPWSRRR